MVFSRGEQVFKEIVESPILPSPRTLFPDLFGKETLLTKVAAPSKPQSLVRFLCHNSDKPLDLGLQQKHDLLNIFTCSEVGCNCDGNILGNSTSPSSSEAYSGSSSCESSPILSSPEGFNYLRRLHGSKRSSGDCNPEPRYEILGAKSQETNPTPHFKRSRDGELQGSSNGSITPFTLCNRLTNFKRVFPIAPNQLKPMPTTVRKPYQCAYCGKRFARPSSLKTHTYSHTGEKPYVCQEEGCHSQFSVLSNLRRHAKLHSGIREESREVGNDFP